MLLFTTLLINATLLSVSESPAPPSKVTCVVGPFGQETSAFYTSANGLSEEDIRCIAVMNSTEPYAGTRTGLYRYVDHQWSKVPNVPESPIIALSHPSNDTLYAVADNTVLSVQKGNSSPVTTLPPQTPVTCIENDGSTLLIGTNNGLFVLKNNELVADPLNEQLGTEKAIRSIAIGKGIAVASQGGLYWNQNGSWKPVIPRNEKRSWAPYDVKAAAFDSRSRLWFASPQGIGCVPSGEEAAQLYTGEDGLPFDDFTSIGIGKDDEIILGTTFGAIRFDGTNWAYRQGRRWLPDDSVRNVACDNAGTVWVATGKGVGAITRTPTTLREKARFFETEIDRYHRRTEYGYVIEGHLAQPGDKSTVHLVDSDNDGLWTSMYGAAECFAYGATKDPAAQKRAKGAFEALRFLSHVTQGGTPPAKPGFVARTILPASGPNPNEGQYTREADIQKQQEDALWKVVTPRWPKSADGKWYWKCDTSSDELDGHFFFYGLYYDLVAETPDEKKQVRDLVEGLASHLVDNHYKLVDWDGKHTRWAIFDPDQLNRDPAWFVERGMNSLGILSYLSVAYHVTENPKYKEAFEKLIREHGYLMNLMNTKHQYGIGSGNQSDDEMIFMNFHNLLKYSPDPDVKMAAARTFYGLWLLERPELNPFFNFIYASTCHGLVYSSTFGPENLTPEGPWLDQSIDTLKRFPLDRCNWRHDNRRRKDILPMSPVLLDRDPKTMGYRRNGYVIPVDECFFEHFNYDPWQLTSGGKGTVLGSGTVFLLPYYMGLYHKFITEE